MRDTLLFVWWVVAEGIACLCTIATLISLLLFGCWLWCEVTWGDFKRWLNKLIDARL